MRQVIIGQPISARDVERLGGQGGAQEFVRLCAALIGATLARQSGPGALPQVTERIDVPDGGVDAEYIAPQPLAVNESGGLVGPGRTVYQFKFRDATRGPRAGLVRELVEQFRRDGPRFKASCDRYVLMTNLDLAGTETRRLVQALAAAPALAGKLIVVLGAAELALALNDAPHVGHLFFGDGRLCTLEVAELELKGAYALAGWPTFVDREGETGAIREFLQDPARRVLQVTGPRYVGKTRLVIEALRPIGSGVAWASSPEVATWELFRELDTESGPSVLVIDRCEVMARDLLERASGREHLKTILIRERYAEGPDTLPLGALGSAEAGKLAEAVLPRGAFLQESWLRDATGGRPGLLLHVAALVRDRPQTRAEDPDEVWTRLGSLLEEVYVLGLEPEMRRSLQVIALLEPLGVEGEGVEKERDAVCAALEMSPRTVESHLGELVRRGLVHRRGRFAEVVPPVLARHVAAAALTTAPRVVAELVTTLDSGALLRFLDRFGDLPGEPVRRAARELLAPTGWFPDLETLVREAPKLQRLAPAAPQEALQRLDRILEPVSVDDARARIVHEARRALVTTLEDLALRAETFAGAAWHLLLLAAAENERWGNNASGVFTDLFSWRHPEVTASLASRATVLERGSREPSPARRVVVARGCEASFRERESFTLHPARGPRVPEGPYRPDTWDEVREYASRVLAVVERLVRDQDPTVQVAARAAVLDLSRPVLMCCVRPDGLKPPGRLTLDLLAEVGRTADTGTRRAEVVSRIELLMDWLGNSPQAAWSVAVELARELRALLDELTRQSFKDRLWRAVGPSSWRLRLSRDDVPQLVADVAQEMVDQPKLLREHVDWLLGDEARRRGRLFQELGKKDSGGELFQILRESAAKGEPWAEELAAYAGGWAESAPEDVEDALDRLMDEQPDAWRGVVRASGGLGPSRRGRERLVRVLRVPSAPRPEVEGEVARSVQWQLLDDATAEQLIVELDRENQGTRVALLDALVRRALGGDKGLSSGLEERAWRLLEESYAGRSLDRHELWTWDELAAFLGRRHPDRLLALLKERVLSAVDDGTGAPPLEQSLPRLWDTLRAHRREGLVRVLLEDAVRCERLYAGDWTLSHLLDLSQDWDTVQELLESGGAPAARVVAAHVDASHAGFWRLAEVALQRWGQDEALRRDFRLRVMSGSGSGSAIPMIESRLGLGRALTSHTVPDVASWAQEVVADLEAWRQREFRQDQEEWIWDYRIRRAELEAMVGKKNSPEWRWAVARLLKDAPRERVLELLTPEEILEALPSVPDLDARRRELWEAWARRWSQAG